LKELFPGDEQLYQRALAIKEQMSLSKSQFRSVIKSRESMKNLANPNQIKNESGNTKNNFFNSDADKNKGFDVNNPNYNSDKNLATKTNNIYNNNENNKDANNLCSGFAPAVNIGSGKYKLNTNDLIVEEDLKQINDILSIKPEVFNYIQKLTLKEFEKMVQNYQGKLNAELLKMLNEEKNNEEKREIMYSDTIDSIDKKRLEKFFSMERNRSSAKILKIHE
jgi:hypothetical protein